MELHLEPDEAALLAQVLTNYLSDLRMEIRETDQYDLRQALKGNEMLLNNLLARIQSLSPGARDATARNAGG